MKVRAPEDALTLPGIPVSTTAPGKRWNQHSTIPLGLNVYCRKTPDRRMRFKAPRKRFIPAVPRRSRGS